MIELRLQNKKDIIKADYHRDPPVFRLRCQHLGDFMSDLSAGVSTVRFTPDELTAFIDELTKLRASHP